MISDNQLDSALCSWQLAHERVVLERGAWDVLLHSQGELIRNMLANGHSHEVAQAEFVQFSEAHNKALFDAIRGMTACCNEYRRLKALFDKQQKVTK